MLHNDQAVSKITQFHQRTKKSGLPLGSLVYLLFCTSRYGWGWKNFVAEADEGKGIRFPKWARVYVSYILPLIVLFIFLMGYKDKFFT